ncbi:hypothetical protein ABTA44_20635, partial [Acinetobacter baumannii]
GRAALSDQGPQDAVAFAPGWRTALSRCQRAAHRGPASGTAGAVQYRTTAPHAGGQGRSAASRGGTQYAAQPPAAPRSPVGC